MMVNSGKACLAPESFLGLDMTIPTEPIGSIPRPQKVITAFEQYERGSFSPISVSEFPLHSAIAELWCR
jgi:methionine synthase II (cobalamin-independent)